MLSIRAVAAFGAAVMTFAIPAGAQAATKSVDVGTPLKQQKRFNETYGADVNDFFPHGITVHVGDRVRFVPVGFHTVDFPGRGGKPIPLLSPSGQKVAGANDAAGAPFWFNGLDALGFTRSLGRPFGGKARFNGTRGVHTGLPTGEHEKPFFVTFAKTGRFTYFCDVHPGMKGTVRVVSRRHRVPSRKADARAVARQVRGDIKVAKGFSKTQVPAGTIDVGTGGRGGVSFLGFLPASTTIPAGTTLRFRMVNAGFEVHTATIGPGDPLNDPSSYLGKLGASFETPAPDPIAVYPSDPPPNVPGVTTTSHGNGFWNSGVMDGASATPPPDSTSVRFDQPGTYQLYCLIHPFMHGTITVQ